MAKSIGMINLKRDIENLLADYRGKKIKLISHKVSKIVYGDFRDRFDYSTEVKDEIKYIIEYDGFKKDRIDKGLKLIDYEMFEILDIYLVNDGKYNFLIEVIIYGKTLHIELNKKIIIY